ncbi:hypothetical protein FB565_000806 [Actinoplanes lutulentus]|uniref:Uncharacterized protein n=1 Tax=Actinoplanes lutulentus TaxID=1287878 RepID=A0A327ZLY9_9ACTN|nr:hypothetical protein [Actinoplanes lutulentus]MBB2941102.1 hypothetical protein [Actinoplanes lutulentus]RAK43411.1 hypothetical protein B0I29_101541 [Actinoplanes lutulentus]
MMEDLVRRAAGDDDVAAEELAEIADSAPGDLTPHHGLMLDLDLLWPAKLFRAADDVTVRRVVAQVDAGQGQGRLNHLLLVLAYSGHPLAEQALRRWSTSPPPGADELYVGSLDYAREGGWTVDTDGSRRELCGDTAYEWLLRESSREPSGATCPWCTSPLWVAADLNAADLNAADLDAADLDAADLNAADLDAADPAVRAALAHTGWSGRLVVETCHFCACYATLFSKVSPDGGSSWWAGNTPPSYLPKDAGPEDPPALLPVPGPVRASPYQVSAWSQGGSTLGGRPDWIQDADHPECPGCGQSMDYLGLIGGADIDDGEGAYYLHLHQPCGFAAVNYQQS